MKSRNDSRAWLLSSVLVIAACGGSSSGNKDGGPGGGAAGSSGGAGRGGAGGTGGSGAAGTTGEAGTSGSAGAAGTGVGGVTGSAGTGGGGAGRGGTTGNAGTGGGAAGRGGTTGNAGTGGGAAGRGGTTGNAGTGGGAAGRGGTTGAAGAGGTTGAGGTASGAAGMGACLASLKVTQVAANSLDNPISGPLFVTGAPGTTDLFVPGQGGKVYLLKNGAGPATVFLDLTSKVKTDNEDGLVGLAFHPGYATNGRFFVNMVTNTSPLTVALAEYARSSANADLADTTEKARLVIGKKDFPNESGGMIAFGSDGYLYLGLGSEPTLLTTTGTTLVGPGGFPVRGAIIRLDVSAGIAHAPGGGSYPAPVWANGLRHPWRFSFDRTTNDMYIGDVGDNTREEIDYEAFAGRAGGRNYGYSRFEGSFCAAVSSATFNADCTAAAPSVVFPIYDYPHAGGDGAVIGGYVYRGKNIPCLTGTYLFGDFLTTTVRAFVVQNGVLSGTVQMVPGVSYVGKTAALRGLTSFGEDNAGEMYLVHTPDNGASAIYRIDPK